MITTLMMTPPAAATGPDDRLALAMAAAGGRDLLSRITAIAWQGGAQFVDNGRHLDITMATRLAPFGAARTETWLTERGPATKRALVIEADGRGYSERGGVRTPLSPAQALHERQQFAAYSYLLLVHAPITDEGARLRSMRPGYPAIQLIIDADGRLTGADYRLAAPRTDRRPIFERMRFSGDIADKGIRWPRRIVITQDDIAFLDLAIATFTVDLAPPAQG